MAPDHAASATADGPAAAGITGIVRLCGYPLDRRQSVRGQALIARCRAMLAADGACLLPSFLTEAALARATAEAKARAGRAYRRPNPRRARPISQHPMRAETRERPAAEAQCTSAQILRLTP
jgi:hypothetical protein